MIGTYDDFGVKNDQKVSHNMILMSKYKGQHGGIKDKKIRTRPPLPPFQAMPERNRFFSVSCSLREAIHRKIKREKKRKTGAQKIFLKPPDWWRA